MGKCPVVPPGGGGEKPFVVGTYTGTNEGDTWRKISLPFTPSAVLLECPDGTRDSTGSSSAYGYGGLAVLGADAQSTYDYPNLRVVDSGFEICGYFNKSLSGGPYRYIAFR